MTRLHRLAWVAVTLAFIAAVPAMAADPIATKRLVTEGVNSSVYAVEVTASSKTVYSVTITDETASIINIIAPKGWVGITSGERTLFYSGEKPIESGKKAVFKVVTTDGSAPLGVTFRGAKKPIGSKQTI
jgi:hypothetical protein